MFIIQLKMVTIDALNLMVYKTQLFLDEIKT